MHIIIHIIIRIRILKVRGFNIKTREYDKLTNRVNRYFIRNIKYLNLNWINFNTINLPNIWKPCKNSGVNNHG